jgi:ABC-type transport system involved in multi-copper enzyme maturation permease subunit
MTPISSILPTAIMSKDLRLRMRGWRWAGVATLYVTILGVIAITFMLQKYSPSAGNSGFDAPSLSGIRLLQTLSIAQVFLITFVTPATVAGAISGERQHRTWDLLMASRVPARDVVWGKLLAGIAYNLVLLAASFPIFCLAFLFGGVGPLDWLAPFAVFVATVVFLGAISLTVSALTARVTVSYMGSMLIALLLTVGLSLLVLYLQVPGQFGVMSVAGVPFQSFNQPAPLSPLAQLDPLVAVLSTLPADSGGPFLGGLGIVHHAFGLPGQVPLWAVYIVLAAIISTLLTFATVQLTQSTPLFRPGGSRQRTAGAFHAPDGTR